MVKSSHLIVILGGDVGAGKSTQAKLLMKLLKGSGVRTCYVELKGLYYISKFFTVLLLVLLYRFTKYNVIRRLMLRGYSPLRLLIMASKDYFSKNFGLISLFNMIDILMGIIKRYYLLKKSCNIIIYEDHIIGYLNDFLYLLYIVNKNRKSKVSRKFWVTAMIFLFKSLHENNTCIIFLSAPYHILIERYYKRGSPIEYHEYVIAGRQGINFLTKCLKIKPILIETSSSIAKTSLNIYRMCLKI